MERSEENSTGAKCGSGCEGLKVGAISAHLYPEHYDSDVGTEDTKYLSTTGAEYGCRGARVNPKIIRPNRQEAFTLTEVLITLSIIGVVAALTIPSLISNNQEKETVVRLKKAYNVISNAFNLAVLDYGTPDSWNWVANSSGEGANNALDKFTPYLNTLRICKLKKGCFPSGITYNYAAGNSMDIIDSSNSFSKAILADGSLIAIMSRSINCDSDLHTPNKLCGVFMIDTNANKGPNRLGTDLFAFYITNEGISLPGILEDQYGPLATCKTGGFACTGWIILKENMDYLHSNISWE